MEVRLFSGTGSMPQTCQTIIKQIHPPYIQKPNKTFQKEKKENQNITSPAQIFFWAKSLSF
jgi:hypothetical protein